ncbi:MAG: papain-like cysteine protease family protein [Dongiaceae bacterium]
MARRISVARSRKKAARKAPARRRARAPGIAATQLVARRFVAIDWFRRLTKRRCLCFAMQHQEQTQWCWSATATSVAHYYNSASAWTQCSLVNAEFGRSDCCASPASANCNKPWYLDNVLTRVGHLAGFANGSTSFANVRAELDNGRPLGVRIGWSGGGGHFNILACYTVNPLFGLQSVQVEDPWYGTSVWDYDTFRTAYQGTGSWTHTYRTQP